MTNLYENVFYEKELQVVPNNGRKVDVINLSIELLSIDRTPDCRIGNFGLNFWFRTPYGVAAKKYKTAKNLEKAVEKVVRTKGFDILSWVTN